MSMHTTSVAGSPSYKKKGDDTTGLGWDSSGNPGIYDANGDFNRAPGFIPFHVTATITSAAAATAVPLLADSAVPAGKKVYLQGYISRVNGSTNWATTANIKIQDTNGTPVDFITIAVNAASTNGNIRTVPGNAQVTLENAFANGTGGTAAKGLQIKGDANGTGSDMIITAWGVIK